MISTLKKVIVTGAFGFIGAYLVDELIRQGYQVLATGHRPEATCYFERRSVPYHKLDITEPTDYDRLPRNGVHALINLAGLMPSNFGDYTPQDYIRINVLGMLNILDYCRIAGVHKVITTTSYADVQNAWTVSPPIDDDTPRSFSYTGDHAMYVISKNTSADCVIHYNEVYGFQGAIFRLPPVYGYGPHLKFYQDGVLRKSGFQIFMEKAIIGEPIEVWGDRTQVRDVVYVKDVVHAFTNALCSSRVQGFYNIASGRGITLEEQARAMVEVFSPPNHRSDIVFLPEKTSGIKPYVFDVTKANRDFDYEPHYTFLEMLHDYKKEAKVGRYDELICSRLKK